MDNSVLILEAHSSEAHIFEAVGIISLILMKLVHYSGVSGVNQRMSKNFVKGTFTCSKRDKNVSCKSQMSIIFYVC